jgi:hypothetical protein
MRRNFDYYPTPEFATNALLNSGEPIGGLILEPCTGDDAIAEVLRNRAGMVVTNDIDFSRTADFHQNILDAKWLFGFEFNWIVTNPPFSLASQIVPLCYERATEGIAMLLRLSFLEPVESRGAWLNEHPPTTLIVLPRISFTNDGHTDSVTCAWMVWNKLDTRQRIIVAENPRFVRQDASQMELVA